MGEYADMSMTGWPGSFRRRWDSGRVCRNCAVSGLNWQRTEAGWRLFEGINQHVCATPPQPSAAESETH